MHILFLSNTLYAVHLQKNFDKKRNQIYITASTNIELYRLLFMKRILIITMLVLSTCFTSCLSDDDGVRFSYERVPVEQVDIPDEFKRGETFKITVSYYRPTDCHSFNGFDYDGLANERTVSVLNVVIENSNCEDLQKTDLINTSFNFSVGLEDSYIFRFWQGRNDQGENQFLIKRIPVVE